MSYPCQVFGFLQDNGIVPGPFLLYEIGIERRFQESYDYDNRNRSAYGGYLFQYTLEGEGNLELFDENGNVTHHRLQAGDAFLVPFPDHSRYYLSADAKEGWSFFFLHFSGTVASQLVEKLLTEYGRYLSFSGTPEFVARYLTEHRQLRDGKVFRRYESATFLHEFLAMLLRETEEGGTTSEDSLGAKGKEWIRKNFTRPCTISDLCNELDVSLPHFSRQFQACFNIAPLTYMNRLRIERAMSMLVGSYLSIQEISEACGFSDSNYFAKVFRKYTGMPPSRYRNDRR